MTEVRNSLQILSPVQSTGTEELLPGFIRTVRSAPGSALWLVPTVRMAADVRRRLVREAPGLLSARVRTPAGFAEEVLTHNDPRTRPLIPIQQRIILDEILAEIYRSAKKSWFGKIAESRGFAENALGMITELKELGIHPQNFRLTLDRLDENSPRLERLRECARIYQMVQDRLRSHQLLDSEDTLQRVCELVREARLAPYHGLKSLIVSGFTMLTRRIEDLLVTLQDSGVEILVAVREDVPRNSPMYCFLEKYQREIIGEMAHARDYRREVWLAPEHGRDHLRQMLFREKVIVSNTAEGIELLEAPGSLGEARMIARRIRELFAEGVAAEKIIVTGRDLPQRIELIEEVFAEYEIPTDCEGAEPLSHHHPVGFLLRAVRVPEDDWPFASVTSLLRSSWFRPDWPEGNNDPEIARRSESLLRLLGEPRGRGAYLMAVRTWAENPPEGLEDEHAEEGRRRRKHRLAKECRPFLERFFRVWDGFPESGTVGQYSRWLRSFAEDLGLTRVARDSGEDQQALESLFAELDRWTARTHIGTPPLKQNEFRRLLSSLTSSGVMARSHRGPGRVRILSAEVARSLETDWLILLGLGEGSFPNTSPPRSLLDDGDRHELRKLDLPFPENDDRLLAEQVLFLQLVTLPKQGLILSYPAIDPRGMPLLPSGFLRHLKDCFAPGVLKTQRQQMLIESWLTETPISPAERRVHYARCRQAGLTPENPGLPAEVLANLENARQMADNRFGVTSFTVHDGWLKTPAIQQILLAKFGADKVFSPTALESYVACPFQFLLGQVLHLQPIEEPNEEIEATRRGSAYHRALARYHRRIQEQEAPYLAQAKVPPEVAELLPKDLQEAIQEYIDRAPSPASRVLWELEEIRLRRDAGKYGGHWQSFMEPWKAKGAIPLPMYFEADFGMRPDSSAPINGEVLPALILNREGVEVRIGGRIDRVDVAEMPEEIGFWIIDYKTGRASNYTSSAMQNMEKLQLPLYALAVQRVFPHGKPARPLGLAYWLVTDGGAKRMMPVGRAKGAEMEWLTHPQKWEVFQEQLEIKVIELIRSIRAGEFPLKPKDENHCTQKCPYGEICRIGQSRGRKSLDAGEVTNSAIE